MEGQVGQSVPGDGDVAGQMPQLPGTLVRVIAPRDEIDSLVVSEIVSPGTFELKVEVVCLSGDERRKDLFLSHVLSLGKHLLKANEHRRRHAQDELALVERVFEEARRLEGSGDYGEESVELDAAFDSFMVEIKAALDDLAKLLDPLFGIKLSSWRKANHPKLGKQLSGAQVLLALENNLPTEQAQRSASVREYVAKNLIPLSELVALRDNPVHRGGSKNVTPVVYLREAGEVQRRHLVYPNGEAEPLDDFMGRVIRDMVTFCSQFMLGVIVVAAPGGLVPTRNATGGWGWRIQPSAVASTPEESAKGGDGRGDEEGD